MNKWPPSHGSLAWPLGAVAFLLYVATLAPTVLWGDSAELQTAATVGPLLEAPRGHFLWLWLARAGSFLPIGNPAYRANLMTAAFAAAGVSLTAMCVSSAGGGKFGMAVAAAALALSHTYWLHAVQAEIYSLHSALLLCATLLFLRWARNPDRSRLLFWTFFLCGIGLFNHQLVLVAVPAFLIAVFLQAAPPAKWRSIAVAFLALGIGLLPFAAVSVVAGMPDATSAPPLEFSLATPRRIAFTVGIYAFQFTLLLPLARFGLASLYRRSKAVAILLGVQIVATALVVTCLNVKDQFVFHQPAYACIAILIGVGASSLVAKRRVAAPWILAGLAVTPLCYLAIAKVPQLRSAFPMKARDLPGRTVEFFLWPPKTGYRSAESYARSALDALEPDALLLADWTLAQPVLYMQEVEARRPDVTVVMGSAGWEDQTAFLRRQSATRPVYTAALDLYYRRDELQREFEIKPVGPVFRLTAKRSSE